jgi:hypothetical protein
MRCGSNPSSWGSSQITWIRIAGPIWVAWVSQPLLQCQCCQVTVYLFDNHITSDDKIIKEQRMCRGVKWSSSSPAGVGLGLEELRKATRNHSNGGYRVSVLTHDVRNRNKCVLTIETRHPFCPVGLTLKYICPYTHSCWHARARAQNARLVCSSAHSRRVTDKLPRHRGDGGEGYRYATHVTWSRARNGWLVTRIRAGRSGIRIPA